MSFSFQSLISLRSFLRPRRIAALLALVTAAACGYQPTGEADAARVASPLAEPGDDRPPVGRSLFDHLVTDRADGTPRTRIPYPLPELIRAVNEKSGEHVVGALIPYGRSLQRMAAYPDVFTSPRVVIAPEQDHNPLLVTERDASLITVDPGLQPHDARTNREHGRMFLSGRLFIAYVEAAAQLEVISFNEAAGRFEFQVVRGYGQRNADGILADPEHRQHQRPRAPAPPRLRPRPQAITPPAPHAAPPAGAAGTAIK